MQNWCEENVKTSQETPNYMWTIERHPLVLDRVTHHHKDEFINGVQCPAQKEIMCSAQRDITQDSQGNSQKGTQPHSRTRTLALLWSHTLAGRVLLREEASQHSGKHTVSTQQKVWSKREAPAGSLVVQWIRVLLPVQLTLAWPLVRGDPTCQGAKPTSPSYWAGAPRAHTLQQEEPAQWETQVPQLEKTHMQHWRPSTAK